jgi:hypothetical protein
MSQLHMTQIFQSDNSGVWCSECAFGIEQRRRHSAHGFTGNTSIACLLDASGVMAPDESGADRFEPLSRDGCNEPIGKNSFDR